ncbi:MAG: S-layer homology domain-containing protein [Oscillospiraceae bacterium]|nr:S-layer homology domain-containing protein [Oscillospiraceae bacterium]
MKNISVKLGALLMAALLTMGLVSGAFAAYGFDDVPEDAWYADAVCRVSQMGYMNGVGGQRFAPKASMTRAMFVTALYRMAAVWTELPAETPAADFADVAATAWYAKPVAWAASQGIVAGRGDGRFDPKAPISRQEMAVMLLRFAQAVKPELLTDDNVIERAFSDIEQVSPYARDAVVFCAHRGFFAGDAAGRCLPKKTATRAEAAQVLMVLAWQIVPAPAAG